MIYGRKYSLNMPVAKAIEVFYIVTVLVPYSGLVWNWNGTWELGNLLATVLSRVNPIGDDVSLLHSTA